MKKVSLKNLYVRDPETGEFQPLMAIRGEKGNGIKSIVLKGKDDNGGNVYTVTMTDGTTSEIVAPIGLPGDYAITQELGDSEELVMSQKGVTENIIAYKGDLPEGTSVIAFNNVGTYSFNKTKVTDLPDNFTSDYGWLIIFTTNFRLLWTAGNFKVYLASGAYWREISDKTRNYIVHNLGENKDVIISQYTVSRFINAMLDVLNSTNENGLNVLTDSVGTKENNCLINGNTGLKFAYENENYSVITYTINEPFIRIKASANYSNYLYSFLDSNGDFIDGEISTTGSAVTTMDKIVIVPQEAHYVLCGEVLPYSAGIFNGGISVPKKWTGKKWTCVGDSLTEKNGRTSLNYHCSNLRPWTEEGRNACYTKDDGNGVHPDETGHKIIASRFEAFLETLLI